MKTNKSSKNVFKFFKVTKNKTDKTKVVINNLEDLKKFSNKTTEVIITKLKHTKEESTTIIRELNEHKKSITKLMISDLNILKLIYIKKPTNHLINLFNFTKLKKLTLLEIGNHDFYKVFFRAYKNLKIETLHFFINDYYKYKSTAFFMYSFKWSIQHIIEETKETSLKTALFLSKWKKRSYSISF